jgi:hypothetical protein
MATVRCIVSFLWLLCFVLPAWEGAAARNLPQLTQPTPVVSLSPVSVKSSVLRRRHGRDALAPLRIETPISPDYVLKLVNAQNGTEEMLIYVDRNSNFETKVPLGTYKIRGAFGPTWYGENRLFGPDTGSWLSVRAELMPNDGLCLPIKHRLA